MASLHDIAGLITALAALVAAIGTLVNREHLKKLRATQLRHIRPDEKDER